ncbi:MAG: amylo-alpha-1,6-glucosidase [Truepera sp.]|nr:amylo-alpha-1,6-glucosidase [Truepera sp.]
MDFSKNLVLKENYTFLVADAEGQVAGGERGLYDRDTRYLSRYRWSFGEGVQALLLYSPRPDTTLAHYALIEGPSQVVGIQRRLLLTPRQLTDLLRVENSSAEPRQLKLKLELAADFADLFEARGWVRLERPGITTQLDPEGMTFSYTAQDGITVKTAVRCAVVPSRVDAEGLHFELALAPRQRLDLSISVQLDEGEVAPQAVSYETWRQAGPSAPKREREQAVLEQALMDLRALLLFTEHGPIPAAGIPWYVAAFGRDALLTALLLLPHYPEVAKGTLRYLAAYQGQQLDPYRAEVPGKIMHELRFGELTRLGKSPHSPYYGTVDATPLFVILLYRYWQATGDLTLVRELRPHWEAALRWMLTDADLDGDGFLEFVGAAAGKGLMVQSWKDSHDSLSHADGRLASGAVAVSEVQGYAYAAYGAAADLYAELGESEQATLWLERAAAIKAKFHQAFWLDDLGTYALALDGDKRPLKVQNSDAGHLLWAGVVPEEVAPRLVATLMSEALWSGWGIRTLGAAEARYNPVSYHNGSVWPHDTALAAGGMVRYGFHEEAAQIRRAAFDLAASQADLRLPELIAGYPRRDTPPVPYPVACRPQAWDAAAIVYLLSLPPATVS